MSEQAPGNRVSTARLILVPTLITLGITLVRLAGELQHWSRAWFNPAVGGPWSIVGITWLAPIFGIYFAVKLSQGASEPSSVLRPLGFAVLGLVIIFAGAVLGSALHVNRSFYGRLIYGWVLFALAAALQYPGWRALFKTLLAYGFAARIPVVIVMFFAFWGNWGTHYDAAPPDFPGMSLWPKFLWLGFFPQLTLWVGFTIVTGMLCGTIAAALLRLRRSGVLP